MSPSENSLPFVKNKDGDTTALGNDAVLIVGKKRPRCDEQQEHQSSAVERSNFCVGMSQCHLPMLSKGKKLRNAGKLTSKIEAGEGVFSTDGSTKIGPSRCVAMSCSDKILKWVIVGLEGSLLGSVIVSTPLKLASVTIGDTFVDESHLQRALCCRAPGGCVGLHVQIVAKPSVSAVDDGKKYKRAKCDLCLNWYLGCDLTEVTSGRTGRTFSENKSSRLCKTELASLFVQSARVDSHRAGESYLQWKQRLLLLSATKAEERTAALRNICDSTWFHTCHRYDFHFRS
jgi:hypothetical protein